MPTWWDCFLAHTWSKWEEATWTEKLYHSGVQIGEPTRVLGQKRVCQVCGKIQLEKL